MEEQPVKQLLDVIFLNLFKENGKWHSVLNMKQLLESLLGEKLKYTQSWTINTEVL